MDTGHRPAIRAANAGCELRERRTTRARRLACVGLTLLLAVVASRAAERPIRFSRLTTEQGLSQSSVLSVFQDSLGYVWMGTEDGLNRYDGLGFEVFKHDSLDRLSIPGNFVWAIEEDDQGNLWVATEDGGVGRFDRSTGEFTSVDLEGGRRTRTLHIDQDGKVWVGMRSEGVRRVDPETGDVRAYRAGKDGLPDDHVYAIHRDPAGNLWIGTDAGLVRHDLILDRFQLVFDPASESGLSGPRIRSIAHDRKGGLWVGTYENGLNRVDPTTGEVHHYRNDPDDARSLSHDRVRALFEDVAGRIWVGTSGGLDLYDPRSDAFDHYVKDPADPHSLADDHVMSIASDRGGVLWVGTRFGGAHKWHPRAWQFGHRRSIELSEADPASPSRVTAFTEDRAGRLWVGAFGEGVAVYDRHDNVVQRYRHDPSDPNSLSSVRVASMFTDHYGDVWVGTLDGGVNRFDDDSGGFERFVHSDDRPGSLSANGVTSIAEDADGVLWVGTFGGGVDRFDRATGTFSHFRNGAEDPATIGNDRVTSVAPAANGLVWVGTHGGGVSLLDPLTGRATRFVHDPDDPNSLGSDLVYFLFVDARGGLWAGTTGGLSHLVQRDVASGSFRTYRERDGLPNDVVYSIQQDRTGRLWFSTNRGLACLDPEDDSVRAYDRSDGLQDLEFNFGAGFTRRNGEMLFGGINGFNAFVPERLRDNEHEPPVAVVSVWRDHEPVEGPTDQMTRIDLDYRQSVVSFEFAALDFDDPARNRFSYRLDGFDKGWVDSGSENRVTYTNLDPGRYSLYVRAANSDGIWNRKGLALDVVVEPPPWQTPWAYGGYTFGVLSLLFGFVQVQRRRVAREEEYSRMLEEQVQHRTRELADRTNELETVNRRLATASLTDSLTGFANRRFLIEYLEKEISLVKRRYTVASHGRIEPTQFDLAFMMIDLDDFKSINDTFGHSTGDEVLRQLRKILEQACRNSDIVIRWGGDEFLVIARDQNATAICALAERIRSKIATHAFRVGGGRVVRMTCSIGYACYPFMRSDVDALTWEQVIGVADRALYVSKRSGRNAWVGLESTETADDATLLAGMRHQLERLVRENQLKLHTSIDRESRTVTWTLED